jgi:hypothetical protein
MLALAALGYNSWRLLDVTGFFDFLEASLLVGDLVGIESRLLVVLDQFLQFT